MKKRSNPNEPKVLDFERPIVELEEKIEELVRYAEEANKAVDLTEQIQEMRLRLDDMTREIFAGLTAWQRIQIARHPARPTFSDYLTEFIEDWLELKGDRMFRDDEAIATGFGRIGGRKVMIVAHRKGRTTKERLACNFGMPHPEGYRKALRKMQLAAKLGLPIVTFINTPGAYPGLGAEERGQAHAIAENLLVMSRLRVPIVCVVLAEGGSGGALGIGVGDRILMLENAYYSVISPEGCAAILWKTADKAEDAARILKITAPDLKRFGVVDTIVAEPASGAHRDAKRAAGLVEAAVKQALNEIADRDLDELLEERYQKIRAIGVSLERGEEEASRRAAARAALLPVAVEEGAEEDFADEAPAGPAVVPVPDAPRVIPERPRKIASQSTVTGR
ncbi:MAG: acetyl-CoA carboxylase carboxyltransferase subunit alpha [Planctomycetota bacterium]